VAIWSRNLEVTCNEDWSKVLGFATQDPGGNLALAVPFNFTGCTAKMQIYSGPLPSSTLILALSTGSGLTFGTGTILGVNVGTITIALTHAQTVALPPGEWFFDLFVYTGLGLQTCYVQGAFLVNPSVTR
jgi:hypothetical protein